MNQQEAATLIAAIKENAADLGLQWRLRPGLVFKLENGVIYVRLDGAEETDPAIPATAITVAPSPGARVMCLITDPTSVYIIGMTPEPGTAVLKVRRNSTLAIPDAGAGTYIQFDTVDLDFFGNFNTTLNPSQYIPSVPGWYFCNGRAVFVANATSRRGYFINKNFNGTTFTVGGQSMQAPATGTAQLGGGGLVYMDGVSDYLGARAIQNSGAPLNLTTTADGSVLEVIYMGSGAAPTS